MNISSVQQIGTSYRFAEVGDYETQEDYSNMLQSMDELIIQGTSSFPRKMDKHDLCDDNKPSFKQSAGRVRITWDMEASNCFIMPHVHNLKGVASDLNLHNLPQVTSHSHLM